MKTKLIIPLLLLLSLVSQGFASVSLILPHRSSAAGTQITVPVKVSDFTDILSAQGTLQFDPAVISFVSVQQYGLPGMNASSFGLTQTATGKLTFSWFDNTLSGVDLADSAVIFSVTFNVTGTAGQMSALSFVNAPTLLEITDINYLAQSLNLINGSITISGSPLTPDLILFADTVNGTQGTQVGVSVRARDFVNINSCQGTLQFDPAVASYAGIAHYGLPGMNAGNFGTSQTASGKLMFSWNDASLAGQNMADDTALFTVLFDLIGSAGSHTDLEFANSPTLIEVTDSLYTLLNVQSTGGRLNISGSAPAADLVYYCDTAYAPQGSLVTVSLRVNGFTDIISLQGTLQFNPAVATFDTISYYGLSDMDPASFGLSQVAGGKLMFSWNDPSLAGVTLADSAIVFSMKFLLSGPTGSSTPLSFVDEPTIMETVGDDFLVRTDSLIAGKLTIISNGTLTVNDPGLLSYCSGDPLSTSYVCSGVYISDNQFILQLSDATGNFSAPLNLDTVNATVSGSFSCLLPVGLPAGIGYRLRVMSTNPFAYSDPNLSAITVMNLPGQAAQPTGLLEFCSGSTTSAYSTAGSTGAANYIWGLYPPEAGSISGTGTLGNVQWATGWAGTARVFVTAVNSCGSAPVSDSLLITVHPAPTAPVLSQNVEVLNSSYASGNQWYFNGTAISGATGPSWTPAANGDYFVIYTDGNGCWVSSDTLNVMTVGVDEVVVNGALIITPNPADGQFSVQLPAGVGPAESVRLYDVAGQCVYDSPVFEGTLAVGHLSNGLYLLCIQTGQQLLSSRVMIAH